MWCCRPESGIDTDALWLAVQLKAADDAKGAGTLAALASRCRPEEAGLERAMAAALLQLEPQVRTPCSIVAGMEPGFMGGAVIAAQLAPLSSCAACLYPSALDRTTR